MTVTVIGTGFVGVVSSAVFSSLGNTVFGLDIDEKKISLLKQAKIPFYEPGLEELVQQGLQKGTLNFTTLYEESITRSDVIIIAVGTPSAADGQADLKFVYAAAESMAPFLKPNAIVAVKSTVPPGAHLKVAEHIQTKTKTQFAVVSLPEFLKEGTAVQDTLHPDRVIIGATEPEVIAILKELHAPLGAEMIVMRPESAQMCKYASNAYLATRITFINQIANLCEVNGANILEVINGMGYDKRIGRHYWYPGLGYGGSCFPKDVRELAAYSRSIQQDGNLMVKLNELNETRPEILFKKYEKVVGGWSGKKVTVLGLSFKPNTDDMREAPSTKIIPLLLQANAVVTAFDPMAIEISKAWFPDWKIAYATSAQEALTDADAVFMLVEWKDLISITPEQFASTMKPGATVIDIRNQYADRRDQIRSKGLQYVGVGLT
jgi:UDPglucose 6-dehydrogenase